MSTAIQYRCEICMFRFVSMHQYYYYYYYYYYYVISGKEENDVSQMGRIPYKSYGRPSS